MSQNKVIEGRDAKTGRFLAGNSGNGGRQVGSRNKLTTEFVDDLYAEWRRSGPSVLKRLAADDPGAFARLVAQILPKELDATLNVNVELFAKAKNFDEAYNMALRYIGSELDGPKLIEAGDAAE